MMSVDVKVQLAYDFYMVNCEADTKVEGVVTDRTLELAVRKLYQDESNLKFCSGGCQIYRHAPSHCRVAMHDVEHQCCLGNDNLKPQHKTVAVAKSHRLDSVSDAHTANILPTYTFFMVFL